MTRYHFGPFQLDSNKRFLLRNGEIVPLTPKALEILLLLVENQGKILDKEQIIKHVWPDTIVEEGNLSVYVRAIRRAMGSNLPDDRYILTYSGRGYSFVAEVGRSEDTSPEFDPTSSLNNPQDKSVSHVNSHPTQNASGATLPELIEPAGGALPLNSPLYIKRPPDEEFFSSIVRYDSIVLVKGARQVGKTSLLARGLQQARDWGARVVLTDFQDLNAAYLESIDKLFLMLAELISDQLELDTPPNLMWNPHIGPSSNFERYWRREVLSKIELPIVWGLDEIDRLFSRDYASEVFGLFRSWHNKRALDPQGPWSRLTLAMAYATEAHLFITDLNQSPFNVGTRLQLDDFTLENIVELNQRFGYPLKRNQDVERLFRFAGGHPYLTNRSMWEIKTYGISLEKLMAQADQDESIFSDHLRRVLVSLTSEAELTAVVRGVLEGRPCPTTESFYRLRSAGIIKGQAAREATIRCELYQTYLQNRL
jgi:DNA-binding winged helix-turn-helix (wHTH) protein